MVATIEAEQTPSVALPADQDPASGVRRSVLLPLDGSPLAERALPYAVALAQERGAPLVLVRVVEIHPYAVGAISAAAMTDLLVVAERDDTATYLAQMGERIRAIARGLAVYTDVRDGDASRALLDAEREYDAQVVVLTTHGRTGAARLLRGSVAESLLRHGRAPILLIRPQDPVADPAMLVRPRRVVVALDGSSLSESAIPEACKLAGVSAGTPPGVGGRPAALASEVILVSVIVPPALHSRPEAKALLREQREQTHAYLDAAAAIVRGRGVAARPVVLVADDVSAAIAELVLAERADLVALSTHGRGSLGRWLYGSVADRVAHTARTPVLLYHPPAALFDDRAVSVAEHRPLAQSAAV